MLRLPLSSKGDDRPKDGIAFMETALTVASMVAIAVLAAVGAGMLYGKLWDEALDAQITAHHVAEATARKELPPEEYAYWRRHERNQEACRGQTWIEQCCTDARPELTCLTHEDIR